MTRTERNGQDFWNAAFTVAFLAIATAGFWYLSDGFQTTRWLYLLGALDVSVMGIATFRLARLISDDKIFTFVRLWFYDAREEDGRTMYVMPPRGPRRTIAELIDCMWCVGVWAALVVGVAYMIHPLGQFFVFLLALAGIGSLLQNISITIASWAR